MSDNTNTAAKGLTTKKIILIFGSLIIICAAVIIGIMLFRDKPEGTPVANASNIEQIQEDAKAKVAKGMFMTHMNTTWNFKDGESASYDAVMGNSSANTYDFLFTLTLPDTNEVLYQSGVIPVGQKLSEIKLEKDLDKGTYNAVAKIQMVDENGQEMESNMSFNITLNIEN